MPVPDLPGLRPSGDRGRETLFNWLAPELPGSDCADLFAGSGVLGFEAASRGAAHVDLVEISPLAVSILLDSRQLLAADMVEVHRANALDWLNTVEAESLDIVFCDPPFDSGLAVRTLQALAETDCIKPGGLVYIEMAARLPELVMHKPFSRYKEKIIGEVRMRLFRKGEE